MNMDLLLDHWELALLLITRSAICFMTVKQRIDWSKGRFTRLPGRPDSC